MLTGIIIGGTALSLLIAAIIIIANIQDRVEKNKHLASKSKVQAIKRPPVNPPQPKSYSSDDRWAQEKEIMNKGMESGVMNDFEKKVRETISNYKLIYCCINAPIIC